MIGLPDVRRWLIGPPQDPLATRLGLRRIDWIRMRTGATGTTFEVVGIAHRHPVSKPIGESAVAALVERGVPLVGGRNMSTIPTKNSPVQQGKH